MSAATFLFLSQEDVIACGARDIRLALDVVEEALILERAGACIEPPVGMIHWGEPHGRRVTVHPAHLGGTVDALGLKWVGSNPSNPVERGLPRATGVTALMDPSTGLPLAIMDGTIISAMRTGAVVGAAARLLAPADASELALVGAGVIARTQLLALREVLPAIRRVRLYDIDHSRAARFAQEMSGIIGLQIDLVGSAEEAMRGADVVAPATNVGTSGRYIRPEWIERASFLVNASINDYLPVCVSRCSRVVVDTIHQLSVPGLLLADAVASGEFARERIEVLGDLLGKPRSTVSAPERVMFSPNGMGILDVALASRVYRRAIEGGVGTRLELWREPHWV